MTTEEYIAQLEKALSSLSSRVEELEKQIVFTRTMKQFKMGAGDSSINMDGQGLWIGKNAYNTAITYPYTATTISINGDFYAKNGVNGGFTAGLTGPYVTVTHGIITSIA